MSHSLGVWAREQLAPLALQLATHDWCADALPVAIHVAHRLVEKQSHLRKTGAFSDLLPDAKSKVTVRYMDGEFDGKTPAAQSRTRGAAFLDLGLALLLDVVRLAAGADPEELAFGDLAAQLAPLGELDRRRRLAPWLEARQDVSIHLAPDGLVDRALMGYAPLSPANR